MNMEEMLAECARLVDQGRLLAAEPLAKQLLVLYNETITINTTTTITESSPLSLPAPSSSSSCASTLNIASVSNASTCNIFTLETIGLLKQTIERAEHTRRTLRFFARDHQLHDNNNSNNNNKNSNTDEIEKVEVNDSKDEGEDEWIEAMTLFGITTSYMYLEGGSLRVKLQGSLAELPILPQVAVLREADLYSEWIPFCSHSALVKRVAHNELMAHFCLTAPFLSRDAVIHAYGVDCLEEEDGVVLLTCRSITQQDTDTALPPEPAQDWFARHGRMNILALDAVLKITGMDVAETTIVATIDPKMPLPYFVTNLIIRNIAGVALYFHQKQSREIVTNPSCVYNERILTDVEFYTNWLLPKIRHFYSQRNWNVHTTVTTGENKTLPP